MTCVAPLSQLKRDITAEAFESMVDMLRTIVHRFIKKYGGEYDELFAEACKVFCEAIPRYDPAKGYRMTTYVYCAVYRHLCSLYWRRREQLAGCTVVSLDDIRDTELGHKSQIENPTKVSNQTPTDFILCLGEVGEDCKNIVNLILYPPKDFCEEINGIPYEDARTLRECVREYLHFQLKWSLGRIEKSFREITEILTQ
jgi:DNA-directed RNA polymerase specialized sigma24 family protein